MRGLALALLLSGCRITGTFPCDVDEQCRIGAEVGQCASGSCAFIDTACESKYRFDSSAGDDLAGECADCSVAGPKWYADVDGDGHGDPSEVVHACVQPSGTSIAADDCDDREPFTQPGRAEVCDGIDNDCAPSTTESCGNGCTPVRRPQPDQAHVYLYCTVEVLWAAARTACANEGFTLVRIDDAAENTFIDALRTQVANSSPSVHIGANDLADEGRWVWPDGSEFWQGIFFGGAPVGGLYSNWQPDEPNDDNGEDCGEMDANTSWNDIDCPTTTRSFVCER